MKEFAVSMVVFCIVVILGGILFTMITKWEEENKQAKVHDDRCGEIVKILSRIDRRLQKSGCFLK